MKDIQQASRRLNKRQMTWFRDDPMYLWLDAKKPVAELVEQIASSLAEPVHIGKGYIDQFCVSSCSLHATIEGNCLHCKRCCALLQFTCSQHMMAASVISDILQQSGSVEP